MKSLGKYSSVIFIILAYSFSSMAFDRLEVQSELIQEKIQQKQEVKNDLIRRTIRYKRLYKICSNTIEFSKVQYAWDSAVQISNLIFANPDEIIHLKKTKKTVSKKLHDDLSSKAFLLAASDCRLSSNQRNDLILSLIIMDSSGKIIGITGMVKLFKWINSARIILTKKSRKLAYSLYTLGLGAGIYSAYEQYAQKETIALNRDKDDATEVTNSNFTSVFNTNELDENTIDISNSIINKIEFQINKLENKLQSLDLIDEQRDAIEDRINVLEKTIYKIEMRVNTNGPN